MQYKVNDFFHVLDFKFPEHATRLVYFFLEMKKIYIYAFEIDLFCWSVLHISYLLIAFTFKMVSDEVIRFLSVTNVVQAKDNKAQSYKSAFDASPEK